MSGEKADLHSFDYIYRAVLAKRSGSVSRLAPRGKAMVLQRGGWASSFSLQGEKQYWPARICGLASIVWGGGLCALHLHHATEAHEGHGKETR